MTISKPLRSWGVLLLALTGPPAIVWSATRAVHALTPPPPAPVRVERFADYIDATKRPVLPDLGTARPIWHGSPGDDAPFFTSFRLSGGNLVALSAARLIAVDPTTSSVVRDVSAKQHESLVQLGATALTPSAHAHQVWLYGWETGDLTLYELMPQLRALERRHVARTLRAPQWLGSRLMSNGPFEHELLRLYESTVLAPHQPDPAPQLTATVGRPLFPGISSSFAKSLNLGFSDVKPDGTAVAFGYQWSDRIDIYDSRTLTLARSIAGPVETKLDFAVANHEGRPVFTLDDESRWSYMDIATTNEVILALYAGVERRKEGQGFSNGRELHAFTWDGRLIGRWRLQQPLQAIEVDASLKTLYALRPRPTPTMVAFDLRPILQDGTRHTPGEAGR